MLRKKVIFNGEMLAMETNDLSLSNCYGNKQIILIRTYVVLFSD